jgi:hypothetical protein
MVFLVTAHVLVLIAVKHTQNTHTLIALPGLYHHFSPQNLDTQFELTLVSSMLPFSPAQEESEKCLGGHCEFNY